LETLSDLHVQSLELKLFSGYNFFSYLKAGKSVSRLFKEFVEFDWVAYHCIFFKNCLFSYASGFYNFQFVIHRKYHFCLSDKYIIKVNKLI